MAGRCRRAELTDIATYVAVVNTSDGPEIQDHQALIVAQNSESASVRKKAKRLLTAR
jgi:hypothetical protein